MIYLPYKHPWEQQNDLVSREPQHRVYFNWVQLRKALHLSVTAEQ